MNIRFGWIILLGALLCVTPTAMAQSEDGVFRKEDGMILTFSPNMDLDEVRWRLRAMDDPNDPDTMKDFLPQPLGSFPFKMTLTVDGTLVTPNTRFISGYAVRRGLKNQMNFRTDGEDAVDELAEALLSDAPYNLMIVHGETGDVLVDLRGNTRELNFAEEYNFVVEHDAAVARNKAEQEAQKAENARKEADREAAMEATTLMGRYCLENYEYDQYKSGLFDCSCAAAATPEAIARAEAEIAQKKARYDEAVAQGARPNFIEAYKKAHEQAQLTAAIIKGERQSVPAGMDEEEIAATAFSHVVGASSCRIPDKWQKEAYDGCMRHESLRNGSTVTRNIEDKEGFCECVGTETAQSWLSGGAGTSGQKVRAGGEASRTCQLRFQ